jgi:hypothetical protein
MSLSHGPSIATSGLVFFYDMQNIQKSWKGAPTTNLVNPLWTSWTLDGSGQANIGTRTITDTYECLINDTNYNTRQYIYIDGISASTTYTFSVQYKKLVGTPTLRFQIQAFNGASYISLIAFPTTMQLGVSDIEGWQTAKYTITTPANTNRIGWWMQDGDDYTTYTHSFSLKNVQCEQQSFATPFVDGTRSNTQAVIDPIGANTLTASSLTYNSDGTFSFNGTSNSITVPFNSSQFTFNSEQTIIIWMKNQSPSSARRNPYDHAYAGAGTITHENDGVFNYYYGTGGGNNIPYTSHTSPFSVTVGETAQICITRNSTQTSWYKNGGLGNSLSNPYGASVVTGTNNITIGSGYAGYFGGNIYALQLYNRSLSISEVQQNFNALRGRYGI